MSDDPPDTVMTLTGPKSKNSSVASLEEEAEEFCKNCGLGSVKPA